MATVTSRYPVPESGVELARRTTGGVLVAAVAALALLAVVGALDLDLGASGASSPFGAVPVVGTTVIAGAGAAVAYAALVRVTDRPVRNFLRLAAVVFLGMLVPVFAFAPSQDVTTVGQAVLVAVHVAVAAPLVAFVVGAVRL